MGIMRTIPHSRSNSMLRSIDPSLLTGVLHHLRTLSVDTLQQILSDPDQPLSEAQLLQSTLPLKSGGLGVRDISQIAPVAFLAGAALAAPFVSTMRDAYLALHGGVDDTPFGTSLTRCLDKAGDMGVEAGGVGGGPRLNRFWERFSPRDSKRLNLQKAWTKGIDLHNARSFRGLLDEVGRARINSASGKFASKWLSADGLTPELRMHSSNMQLAVRQLLGAPLLSPVECVCGLTTTDFGHFHKCVKIRRTAVNNRHDLIKNQLAMLCRQAGCSVVVEQHGHLEIDDPAHELKVQGKRPDLSVSRSNGLALLDVSVTHPSAPSYLRQAALKNGSAAVLRERAKTAEYKEYAVQARATFVPFVMESHGTWGKQARLFIDRMGTEAEAFSGQSASSFRSYARSVLSMTLQLGNARLIQFCQRGARHRRPPIRRQEFMVRLEGEIVHR